MSVSSRLISGTAASWVQIGITMTTQIVLVPLYLSYWKVETYGLWLAILSFANILTSLDMGYQEYLGYEFLRIGKNNPLVTSKYLSSGIIIGFALGIVQIFIIIFFLSIGTLPYLLSGSANILDQKVIIDAGIVLLMQGFSWLICGSIGGILTRALSTFGYYPRMAWWSVFAAILMNLAPAVAVVLGAGLLETGITIAAVRIVSDIPIYIDMLLLLKKEKIRFIDPSVKLGWTNFVQSISLSLTFLFENFRQQGARLLLTPLSGAAGLAAFSTMRTGTNVAMQGLHTITNPLMPELMRFLHQRDQARSEVAFGTVWIITVSVLAPALVGIQAFVQPLYSAWTRGQIPFNPWLFAVLSLTVLVYAITQPAISVVRGNNLVKPQMFISTITAAVTVIGIAFMVPFFGILGAGVALLSAEIIASISYRAVASKWLHQNGLVWPAQPFSIAVLSVGVSAIAMGTMILMPEKNWIVLFVAIFFLILNCRRYWQVLPALATERAKNILINLPVLRLFLSR